MSDDRAILYFDIHQHIEWGIYDSQADFDADNISFRGRTAIIMTSMGVPKGESLVPHIPKYVQKTIKLVRRLVGCIGNSIPYYPLDGHNQRIKLMLGSGCFIDGAMPPLGYANEKRGDFESYDGGIWLHDKYYLPISALMILIKLCQRLGVEIYPYSME